MEAGADKARHWHGTGGLDLNKWALSQPASQKVSQPARQTDTHRERERERERESVHLNKWALSK